MNTITIDDFAKVEIRVGTVLSAEKAEGADKLLRLIFAFGEMPEKILNQVQDDEKEIATSSANSRNDKEFKILPELAEKYPGKDVRQIMSAIAEFFPDPSVLVGKQICVCTNLEPRTFRGHMSQGMILAVDNPEGGITFIGPEGKVPSGVRLH